MIEIAPARARKYGKQSKNNPSTMTGLWVCARLCAARLWGVCSGMVFTDSSDHTEGGLIRSHMSHLLRLQDEINCSTGDL